MSRVVPAQSVIYDQLDFYVSGTTRLSGIVVASLSLRLFVNNQILAWNLVDGTTVVDSSISATNVYFNEISGQAGYYSIRFFPDRVGFWRLIFNRSNDEVIKEFDVTSSKTVSGGIIASFTQ